MDNESLHIRYLILIAAVLCAVIIGYNAFYVPDASMTEIRVSVDSSPVSASSVSGEAYVPKSVSSAPAVSVPDSRTASDALPAAASVSGKTSALPAGKINLNTATVQQLSDGLKGVGNALAQRIVDYREQHGNFRSVDELKNVSGIGEKKLEAIRGSVTVE